MTLSSNTLFHFTDRIEGLISILTHEFRPHYALEDLADVFGRPGDERDPTIGISMVCFCDIPLSQTTRHMQTYGNYALGLTKEWGMEAGLAPVIYSHPTSGTSRAILELYERGGPAERHGPDGQPRPAVAADFNCESERLVCFLKPYRGRFHRRGQPTQDVTFYDEREWRYVPLGPWRAIERSEYTDFRRRHQANDELSQIAPLSFEPADIRYVIVADETEILPMIEEIKAIKAKYSASEVELLCSRILTASQIATDF